MFTFTINRNYQLKIKEINKNQNDFAWDKNYLGTNDTFVHLEQFVQHYSINRKIMHIYLAEC